jgi:hypothetical protein
MGAGGDRAVSLEKPKKLTKSQATWLRYAKRKFDDGRVPPYLFRDYRSIKALLNAGFIEWKPGFGTPMYRFTHLGLDALETAP